MDAVFAAYVVLMAGVGEVIELDIVLDAFPNETQAVLPDNGVVNCSLTD